MNGEIERIKKAYAGRESAGKTNLYNVFKPAALFESHQREKAIVDAIKVNIGTDLSGKRILDVGCGTGGILRDFLRYGALPENCFGIDLLSDRIEKAKCMSPNIDFKCGNAEALPYEESSFDLVLACTVFSSVINKEMKQNIAGEMLRVLKSDGIILWYDFHMNSPKNPDVKGVKKDEIHVLFSGCEIHLKRVTLAPPIARAVSPYSWLICYMLKNLVILNTHYLGVIRRSR